MKTFLQFCRNCYLVKAHIAHETCSNARSMLKTLVYKRVTERETGEIGALGKGMVFLGAKVNL